MSGDLLDLLPPAYPPPPEASAGVEAAEAARDAWWWSCGMKALEYLAASGYEFTSEDLIADEVGLPEPRHPSQYGALFRAAAKSGLIQSVGARPSTTPSRRGGLTRVWRGVAA